MKTDVIITRDRFSTFPLNLMVDIFEGNKEKADAVYIPGVMSAVNSLDEDERQFVILHYYGNTPITEIAREIKKSADDVLDIRESALNNLRKAEKLNCMTAVSKEQYLKIAAAKKATADTKARLEKVIVDIVDSISQLSRDNGGIKVKPTSIDNMTMSARTYSVLKRAGINDITELNGMSVNDIKIMRNLGPNSFKEIVNLLATFGMSLDYSE